MCIPMHFDILILVKGVHENKLLSMAKLNCPNISCSMSKTYTYSTKSVPIKLKLPVKNDENKHGNIIYVQEVNTALQAYNHYRRGNA